MNQKQEGIGGVCGRLFYHHGAPLQDGQR